MCKICIQITRAQTELFYNKKIELHCQSFVILLKIHLQDCSLLINDNHVHCLSKDLMTKEWNDKIDIPRQIKKLITTRLVKLFPCFRGVSVFQKDLHTKLEFLPERNDDTICDQLGVLKQEYKYYFFTQDLR